MSHKSNGERVLSPAKGEKMDRFADHEISMIFVCQTCGKGFLNETELAQHNMAGHSAQGQSNFKSDSAEASVKQEMESDVQTQDKRCSTSNGEAEEGQGEEYSTFEIELIAYEMPEKSQKPMRRSLMKSPRKKKTFKCVVCLEEFGKKKELTAHMELHPDAPETKLKNATCHICNKTFSHTSAMVKHQRIHSGEKPYKCDVCDKAFNAMCNLVTHKRIHSGEKPFTCKTCGKSFSVQCNLTTHSRIHSGEKPFQCDLCDKSFSVYHNMLIHKRIHSGEKPFACEVCKKEFSVQCNLVTHMRTHSGEKPYECKLCGKNFRAQCNLNTHMHVHSVEKPHTCEVCGKGFGRTIALERHRKTHLKPKNFECAICKQSFNSKNHLKRHQDTHATFISISLQEADSKNEDEKELPDESKDGASPVDIQPLNQDANEISNSTENEIPEQMPY